MDKRAVEIGMRFENVPVVSATGRTLTGTVRVLSPSGRFHSHRRASRVLHRPPPSSLSVKTMALSSISVLSGHIRDPNNQLHVVKNLRICVNNVATGSSTPWATLSPAQGGVLGDVVSSCQPHEGAVSGVITAGGYELSVSGKKPPTPTPSPGCSRAVCATVCVGKR